MATSASEKCPVCGRDVKPGTRCADTACPYELSVGSSGHMVLHEPLRLRIGADRADHDDT